MVVVVVMLVMGGEKRKWQKLWRVRPYLISTQSTDRRLLRQQGHAIIWRRRPMS